MEPVKARDETFENQPYRIYSFTVKGYDFVVYKGHVYDWWTVCRKPKGIQRNDYGKTFHDPQKMVAAYKTARDELAMIAADQILPDQRGGQLPKSPLETSSAAFLLASLAVASAIISNG